MSKKPSAKKKPAKPKAAKTRAAKPKAAKTRATRKTVTKKKAGTRATGRSAGTQKTWIVTTSPGRPIGEVARDLTKAGLGRHQVLKEIGSIVGSASDDTVARMRRVRGVAAVEPETPIDIGPPDSPTTW